MLMTAEPEQTSETGKKSSSTPANPWKRRWVRVVTYISVIVVAILIAMPLVARQQLEKYLLENGANYAVIENIDFNPFSGTFVLHGMDVKLDDKTVFSDSVIFFDLAWRDLFSKGIVLEKVTLQGVTVDVEQLPDQSWRVGSLTFGAPGDSKDEVKQEVKKEVTWWLGLDKVELKDSSLKIVTPQLNAVLHLDDIIIDSFDTRPGETDANITLKLRLNESPVNANFNLKQLFPFIEVDGKLDFSKINLADFSGLAGDALQTLAGLVDLKGDFNVKIDSDSDTDFAYKGIMELSNTDIASPAFATTGETIHWDGDIKLNLKDGAASQNATVNGSLTAAVLSVKLPEQAMDSSTGSLSWLGNIDYSGEEAGQDIQLKGQLDGNDIAVSMAQQNLSINQKSISATPELSLKLAAESSDIAGNAALQLGGLFITDTARQLVLLAVESLDIEGIKAESMRNASVAGININGTSLIQGVDSESPSVTIGATRITTLDWGNETGLGMASITVSELTGTMNREEDGSMDLITAFEPASDTNTDAAPDDSAGKTGSPAETAPLETTDNTDTPTATDTEAVAEEAAPSQPMPIRIGEITLQQDSTFTFIDKSVSPTFEAALTIESLHVKDIDSTKPDQPIAVKLDGKLNKYAKLDINGTVKPFSEQPAVDLAIKLHGQNMVALSPYMISSTGYLVQAGQLDFDSTIVIDKGVIDAQNKAFMKKLRLEEAHGELVKKNAGEIGMPLDKAMGMLRDKNDNITLEIPIQGKLGEIEIGTGQIINTVLKKATTAGMKTYLLLAFQPYGALIMVGEAVGKQAGKIRLDPVVFMPEASELTDKHKGYLEKLGKVMTDRPKIIVQLCGFTTAADLYGKKADEKGKAAKDLSEQQIKEMFELGTARQQAIKDYMISNFKVNDGRLVTCAPEHDLNADAESRVELLI